MKKIITLTVDASDLEDAEYYICIRTDGSQVYRDKGEGWVEIKGASVAVEDLEDPA